MIFLLRMNARGLTMRHRLDIGLLSAFLVAFALTTSALAQPADLVLRGGKVITVDRDWRVAQAVAIRDGRFLAVGDDAAIAGHIGPNTQVIELAGKTVVPGLVDSHLHQLFAGLNGPAVQLLGSRTVAEVQKAIAERVARTEPGKWVMASSGWHESILEEGRMPTRQVLKGYALGTEHAITAKEALTLYTINNARIMGVEKERGSVEPGKLADLAVLSQDILSVPADAIRETKAVMTVVGGKVVYRNGI